MYMFWSVYLAFVRKNPQIGLSVEIHDQKLFDGGREEVDLLERLNVEQHGLNYEKSTSNIYNELTTKANAATIKYHFFL